jgi:hypothetical protein
MSTRVTRIPGVPKREMFISARISSPLVLGCKVLANGAKLLNLERVGGFHRTIDFGSVVL